jgi:hypothetical protein
MDSPVAEKKQGKSCCSGKKRISLETTKEVKEIAVPQDREIVPTIKQGSGCQCCSNKPAEDKPVEECTSLEFRFSHQLLMTVVLNRW